MGSLMGGAKVFMNDDETSERMVDIRLELLENL